MGTFLYAIVEFIARIHSYIMRLNDSREYNFSDKQLHFLVIGILGMILIFIVYPVFKWLSKKGFTMIVTWIYVFTVIIVISFAIEIGQKVTGTGLMEFDDIAYGIAGFLTMFLAFAFIRMIWHLITGWIKNLTAPDEQDEE